MSDGKTWKHCPGCSGWISEYATQSNGYKCAGFSLRSTPSLDEGLRSRIIGLRDGALQNHENGWADQLDRALAARSEGDEESDYLPSTVHGQFTATETHEARHKAECPCRSKPKLNKVRTEPHPMADILLAVDVPPRSEPALDNYMAQLRSHAIEGALRMVMASAGRGHDTMASHDHSLCLPYALNVARSALEASET